MLNKLFFLSNNFYTNLFIVDKSGFPQNIVYYFLAFIMQCYSNFIFGFLFKTSKLFLFVDLFFLQFLSYIFKFNNFLSIDSLLDINCIDYPNFLNTRFCISYSFWSFSYGIRYFLRSFTNTYLPVISISSFFPSASWLEREV